MKSKVKSFSAILLVLTLNFFNGNSISVKKEHTDGYLVFELPPDCEMITEAGFSVELNCTNAKITIDKYSKTILKGSDELEVFETWIQCIDQASPYGYLSHLNYTSDSLALVDCPFPEKGSLAPGWSNLKKLYIEHDRIRYTYESALKPEHFDGMESLVFLSVEVNSKNGITGDLFENLTEIKEIVLDDKLIDPNAMRNMKNVETIDLAIKTVQGAQEFTALPLKHLEKFKTFNLRETDLGHLTKKFFAGAHRVTYLKIADCNITKIDEDALDNLPNMRQFYYWSNNLTAFPERLFKNKTELHQVNILFNRSLKSLPNGFLSNLPQLTSVSITNNGLVSIPVDLFRGSTNLYGIELTYNEIEHFPNELIAGLGRLRYLKIYGNSYNSYDVPSDYFVGTSARIYF